jgi:hypothetical protein
MTFSFLEQLAALSIIATFFIFAKNKVTREPDTKIFNIDLPNSEINAKS